MDNNYQAFLLRLQRFHNANHWRATLENAHTGEIINFANEKELLLHLHKILKDTLNQEQSKG